jgi:Flp pilus assembly protein TadB
MPGELLKTPLLKEKPSEPTPDRFRLPRWPGSPDGSIRSLFITFITTFLIMAVILLASGQWLWGSFLVAAAVLLAMPYRQLAAAERLLDETERKV